MNQPDLGFITYFPTITFTIFMSLSKLGNLSVFLPPLFTHKDSLQVYLCSFYESDLF